MEDLSKDTYNINFQHVNVFLSLKSDLRKDDSKRPVILIVPYQEDMPLHCCVIFLRYKQLH